jgi:hypothetical protein
MGDRWRFPVLQSAVRGELFHELEGCAHPSTKTPW